MSFKKYSKIGALSLATMFTAIAHADTDLNTPEAYKTCYPATRNIKEIMLSEYHLPRELPSFQIDHDGTRSFIEKGYRIFEGDKGMAAMTRDFAATATQPPVTCIISVRVGHTDAEGQKLWATVSDRPLKW